MTTAEHPDDDLVSAVLDGESSADERDRVLRTPRLSDRLEEFRRLRVELATEADDDLVSGSDVRIAAAMTLATELAGTTEDTIAEAVSMARRRPAPMAWTAVAAALILVLSGALIVRLRDDRGRGAVSEAAATTTTSDGRLDMPSAGSSPGAGERSPASAAPTSGTADAANNDLGTFASTAQLRTALGAQTSDSLVDGAGPSTIPVAPSVSRATDGAACRDALVAQGVEPSGRATVAGAAVVVGRRADGGIVIVAPASCNVIP